MSVGVFVGALLVGPHLLTGLVLAFTARGWRRLSPSRQGIAAAIGTATDAGSALLIVTARVGFTDLTLFGVIAVMVASAAAYYLIRWNGELRKRAPDSNASETALRRDNPASS